MRYLPIVFLAIVGCGAPEPGPASPPSAPSPGPGSSAEPEFPGVRNAHSMAYHGQRREVLVFGGADEGEVRGDTWAWNGSTWSELARGGPPPRTFASMAYDAARRQILLFGGNRVLFGTGDELDSFLGDTWVFEGDAWREIDVESAPAPRGEAAMVYDPVRQRVVLFGGYKADGGRLQRFSDTWAWDGATWAEIGSEGPGAGNGASMAFQADSNRLVLFGGTGAQGKTWAWDGGGWSAVGVDAPGRYNSAMAGNPLDGTVLRFGGWDGEKRGGKTWVLSGDLWKELDAAGPAPRNHSALAFDGERGRAVLFGGHDGERVFGDLWEWDRGRWIDRGGTEPRRRLDNGH